MRQEANRTLTPPPIHSTELKDAVANVLEEMSESNKENATAVDEVKQVREKIDTLQEAVALLAKSMATRHPNTPKKGGGK